MKLRHQRMIAVDGVAAAGVVAIAAPVGRIEVIEDLVCQPLEVDRRAVRAAFGGVIEHHVEQHADARIVQRVAPVRGTRGAVRLASTQ